MKKRIIMVLMALASSCYGTDSASAPGKSEANAALFEEVYDEKRGSVEVVLAALLDGASVHARCELGCTPLMCAARNGFLPFVKALIAAGADIDAVSKEASGQNTSAVMEAARYGHLAVIKELVSAGVNLNSKILQTVLAVAAEREESEVIQYLLTLASRDDLNRFHSLARLVRTAKMQAFADAIALEREQRMRWMLLY